MTTRCAICGTDLAGDLFSAVTGEKCCSICKVKFIGGLPTSDVTTKLLEIRDRGTFIPALAIRVSGNDGYLMRRAGFRNPMVYLITLATEKCAYDPWGWGNRTMNTAHQFIEREFDTLKDGDVVDVEFILGESRIPKCSEQVTVGDDIDGVPV